MHHIRLARPDELEALIHIDDEASILYANAGLPLAFDSGHPFVLDESVRWRKAINEGLAYVACDNTDCPVGFMILSWVDGDPYVDQLSVHPNFMRQGVGSRLLQRAISWSEDRPLWLTTYSHLAWNRLYYERFGFVMVPQHQCGLELSQLIKAQRAALPDPDYRVAMVRRS